MPILLPLGDVIDLGTVDAERALASDADTLTALAGLYGTTELAGRGCGPLGFRCRGETGRTSLAGR